MKQRTDYMRVLDFLRNMRNAWDQYWLEDSCEGALSIFANEHPEYISKIRRWVETDSIPPDNDLQTLCRVYQRVLSS
jgi:hypothetical protein